MNSLNRMTGHHVSIPEEWLPPPTPPRVKTPPKAVEKDSDEEEEDFEDANKKKGGKKQMTAKQKAFERMLADIDREAKAMERERERMLNASADEAKARKEAERLKREQIIAERERRVREREERRVAREGLALAKRREADARMLAYKMEEEARVLKEMETKTKHSYKVQGKPRPDGRLASMKVKEKSYMYFGDFADVGKAKTDELRDKWGKFADPDLYFWVPHGYGEWRNHSAEEPFMEGEMVSGVMTGMGTYRFGEADGNGEYKGLFQNDRPQGFGVETRPTGDPEHPIEHRLAVYQKGKPICFLDELRPGARIKLFGQEHFEFLSDPRNVGAGARPSTLPVMPHARAPYRSASILEAAGGPGVFRVKPDFGQSMVVNLSSTLWDLEKPHQPLFQGVELLTGETDEARYTYDPHGTVPSALSDHRENFFGPSSRLKLQVGDAVEKQKVMAAAFAARKEEEKKKAAIEAKAEAEKADRAEARKMLELEKKRAKAEQAAEASDRAQLGLEFALKQEAREATLAKSKGPAPGGGGFDLGGGDFQVDENGRAIVHVRKPFKPNSGRLIFDDQRWTFIPNGISLPGPPNENDERAKKKEAAKNKAKALAMKGRAAAK